MNVTGSQNSSDHQRNSQRVLFPASMFCRLPLSWTGLSSTCSKPITRVRRPMSRKHLSRHFSAPSACKRTHPLSNNTSSSKNRSAPNTGDQQWSTKTLVGLATFVGAASYTIAKATAPQQQQQQQEGSKIKIPNPSQTDFDNALREVKQLLPKDGITTETESLQSCISPWSCALSNTC